MRESASSKARRYVSEGRLLITEVNATRISAICRGDGAIYALGLKGGEWFCDCPAVTRSCSHLLGLRLVVVADPRVVGADVRIGTGDASRFEARR